MSMLLRLSAVLTACAVLAGCATDDLPVNTRHYVPISSETLSAMRGMGMTKDAPIMMRAYKKESELEVWKQGPDGRFALLKTYPMCRWSGQLGPKKKEGDRQVPEGFYQITRSQLNPNSRFYLSFNIGYPNQLDRAFGRTGAAIMVHGACSSMGCFSMTDEQMADIYALTREAFDGGQDAIQMQSFPFRMTAENLARYRADENIAFWRNLKEGHDHFEVTRTPPKVATCSRKYVFNVGNAGLTASAPCPELERNEKLEAVVAARDHRDWVAVAALIKDGKDAVKRVYADGDQHRHFRNRQLTRRNGGISAPDLLARGPRDTPVDEAKEAAADQRILALAARPPVVAPEIYEPAPAAARAVPTEPTTAPEASVEPATSDLAPAAADAALAPAQSETAGPTDAEAAAAAEPPVAPAPVVTSVTEAAPPRRKRVIATSNDVGAPIDLSIIALPAQ